MSVLSGSAVYAASTAQYYKLSSAIGDCSNAFAGLPAHKILFAVYVSGCFAGKLTLNVAVQDSVRDMVVRWMQQYVITDGFYFGSSLYDACTVACLGKSNLVEAKQNLPKFTQAHTMVRVCLP